MHNVYERASIFEPNVITLWKLVNSLLSRRISFFLFSFYFFHPIDFLLFFSFFSFSLVIAKEWNPLPVLHIFIYAINTANEFTWLCCKLKHTNTNETHLGINNKSTKRNERNEVKQKGLGTTHKKVLCKKELNEWYLIHFNDVTHNSFKTNANEASNATVYASNDIPDGKRVRL